MSTATGKPFATLKSQRKVPRSEPPEETGILAWTQSDDSTFVAIDKQHLLDVSPAGGVDVERTNSLDSDEMQSLLWTGDINPFDDFQRVAILRQPAGPEFTGSKRFTSFFRFGGPVWRPDKEKSWTKVIKIPILHLHCPKKQGCKTSYEVTEAAMHGGGMSLKALDSGFESETELSYTFTSKLDTQDGDCIWLQQKVRVAYVPGTITDDDLYIAGVRIGVEEAIGNPIHESIPEAKDRCTLSLTELESAIASGEATEFPRSGIKGKGGLTESAEVSGKWSTKLSLGLSIGLAKDLDLSAGFTMSHSIAEALKYSYTLVGGSRYVQYPERLADPLSTSREPCWTTE